MLEVIEKPALINFLVVSDFNSLAVTGFASHFSEVHAFLIQPGDLNAHPFERLPKGFVKWPVFAPEKANSLLLIPDLQWNVEHWAGIEVQQDLSE